MVTMHEFSNKSNSEDNMCDVCGGEIYSKHHPINNSNKQERRRLIARSVYVTLETPIVQEAIAGLSTIAQKKLRDRVELIIDKYTDDPNHTLTEGVY